MENITLEKIIKFDSTIVSLEELHIDNNLKYELLDDDTHARGSIEFNWYVKTLLETKNFNESVDVDIFAPFEKHISREEFKIEVKDYSYVVSDNKLIVYFVVSLTGFKENEVDEEYQPESKEELVNDINTLNETITEKVENRSVEEDEEVSHIVPTKIKLKDNEIKEEVKDSWATDIFKLSETYTVFLKLHKD